MKFREVSDDLYQEAGDVIKAANGNGPRVFPKVEMVATGAALALERGAPRILAASYDTSADEYLKEGSRAWRKMHGATARYLDFEKTDLSADILAPSEGIKMIVADVAQRISADKIVNAAKNKDLEELLLPEQKALAEMAREDKTFRDNMALIAVGSFERLSPDVAKAFGEALETPMGGRLQREVEIIGQAVNGFSMREASVRQAFIDGDEIDFLKPISDDSHMAVRRFHEVGAKAGDPVIEDAMELLARSGHVPANLNSNSPIMIAQARLVENNFFDLVHRPSDYAAIALSDAAIMEKARKSHSHDIETQSIADGAYHELPEEKMREIQQRILSAEATPAIDRLRLEMNHIDNSPASRLENVPSLQTRTSLSHQMAAAHQAMGR